MAFEYQTAPLPDYEDADWGQEEVPEIYAERQIPLQAEKKFEIKRKSEEFEENM